MARHFVTGQWLTCTDVTELNSVATFTISGWFKRDDSSKTCCISKGTSATTYLSLAILTDGKIYGVVSNGGSSTHIYITNNSAVWQHVAMVYNGGEGTATDRVKLYVNGSFVTLVGSSGTLPTTTANNAGINLIIGRYAGFGFNTNGDMAEVKLWTNALSANEILMDWAGVIPARDTLVGYWPIGYGSPEPDYSGSGYAGTLTASSPTISDHSPQTPPQFGRDIDMMPYAVAAAGGGGKLIDGFLIDNYLVNGSLIS